MHQKKNILKSKKNHEVKVPKAIKFTAKTLSLISDNLTVKFCSKIFTTPIKHKTPKREFEMDNLSTQVLVQIPKIKKEVVVYHYGDSPKKVLLVHGWSGRGTQLVKIADELLSKGFSTISYDAPAHGKSGTSTTLMPEFIATNLELEKLYGPFEFAIGHSLGGMSLLNSVKQGLNIKKLVTIGSADKITDILLDFVGKLELKPVIAEKMKIHFEKKFGEPMENYASHRAAQNVQIPTLVVHDKNDYEVPIICGVNIHKNLPKGTFLETTRLGHRKILGDQETINKIINFLL